MLDDLNIQIYRQITYLFLLFQKYAKLYQPSKFQQWSLRIKTVFTTKFKQSDRHQSFIYFNFLKPKLNSNLQYFCIIQNIMTQPQLKNQHNSDSSIHFIPLYNGYQLKIAENGQNKCQKLKVTKAKGKWTQSQDLIYLNFLLENQSKLSSECLRRSTKVFKELSAKLNYSRTPDQCRMHHHKMKRYPKNLTIPKIITFLRKKYNLKTLGQQKQQNMGSAKKLTESSKRQIGKETALIQNKTSDQPNFKIRQLFYLTVQIDLNTVSIW